MAEGKEWWGRRGGGWGSRSLPTRAAPAGLVRGALRATAAAKAAVQLVLRQRNKEETQLAPLCSKKKKKGKGKKANVHKFAAGGMHKHEEALINIKAFL